MDAVRRAVERIAAVEPSFGKAMLRTVDVTGIAPAMPMTDRETLEGARLRAKTVTKGLTPPFLAIGLEGGLSSDPMVALTSWAAATDGTKWGYGAGGRIVLPESVLQQVQAGRELGDVIDEMAGKGARTTRGAWGWLTRDLVNRKNALLTATLAALAPFYNADLYR